MFSQILCQVGSVVVSHFTHPDDRGSRTRFGLTGVENSNCVPLLGPLEKLHLVVAGVVDDLLTFPTLDKVSNGLLSIFDTILGLLGQSVPVGLQPKAKTCLFNLFLLGDLAGLARFILDQVVRIFVFAPVGPFIVTVSVCASVNSSLFDARHFDVEDERRLPGSRAWHCSVKATLDGHRATILQRREVGTGQGIKIRGCV